MEPSVPAAASSSPQAPLRAKGAPVGAKARAQEEAPQVRACPPQRQQVQLRRWRLYQFRRSPASARGAGHLAPAGAEAAPVHDLAALSWRRRGRSTRRRRGGRIRWRAAALRLEVAAGGAVCLW